MVLHFYRGFASIIAVALLAVGCGTDTLVEVENNDTSANTSPNNVNVTTANNTTPNVGPGNNTTPGNNTGNNTTPGAAALPTTFSLTNGGGSAVSKDHRVTLSVGSPQPHGQASDGSVRAVVGPIVPVAQP
jgi:hypothetical protein